MKHRLRITYSIDGPLRYTSQLEQMSVWERSARRAQLPLAYSQGFNPRPRIQIASALPVGFAARGEWVDLWLTERIPPGVVYHALQAQVPPGLGIVRVAEVDRREPALQSRLHAAEYTATVETSLPGEEIRQRVADLLAAESLPRERRGKSYDLRPLVEQLSIDEIYDGVVTLRMRLSARPGATGRPEEVLDALGWADDFFRITRQRIMLTEGKTKR
jgi:radical SAM-linked protein